MSNTEYRCMICCISTWLFSTTVLLQLRYSYQKGQFLDKSLEISHVIITLNYDKNMKSILIHVKVRLRPWLSQFEQSKTSVLNAYGFLLVVSGHNCLQTASLWDICLGGHQTTNKTSIFSSQTIISQANKIVLKSLVNTSCKIEHKLISI